MGGEWWEVASLQFGGGGAVVLLAAVSVGCPCCLQKRELPSGHQLQGKDKGWQIMRFISFGNFLFS